MMPQHIDRLIEAARLVPRAEAFDWDLAERTLGIEIPPDYRTLLDAGGAGLWFRYIRLYAPAERYTERNLLESSGEFDDLKFSWEEGYSDPPDDLSNDARLIPWASTTTGENLYWRTDADAPADTYPIYLESADGDEWERFDMSVTDLLVGILRGDVQSELFSQRELRVDEVFRPYDEQ
ncbi:hypothetical protein ACFT2C_05725 [Promicromonospora sp. NPDC057138]|uniref:hypothetical protein n=1 Tax=Promicromonospora sp. NPDC057138 TaxID=3346031 RepID=UPI00362DB6F6